MGFYSRNGKGPGEGAARHEPGGSGGGYKPTEEERDSLIEYMSALLCQYQHRSEIRQHFREEAERRYNWVPDWRTCDAYVSRAQSHLRKLTERPKEEHAAEQWAITRKLLLDEKGSVAEKAMLIKILMALTGTKKPTEFRIESEGHLSVHDVDSSYGDLDIVRQRLN